MSWEALIAQYGYLVVFAGMFLEGEAVLIMGALLAHRGDLELAPVILAGFIGAWLIDHIFFLLGRFRGRPFLDRRPLWKDKSERFLEMLHHHHNWLIVCLRFMWGFRTVGPFMVGVSGVPIWKFTLLDGIGSLAWATVFGILGYFIGNTLQLFIEEIREYESALALMIGVIGVAAWAAVVWSHRQKQKRVLNEERNEEKQ